MRAISFPEPVIVAVSGGADSVALLRAVAAPLVLVAHAHHGLRGADADADEAFVRQLAADNGCDYATTRLDVVSAGGNVESTARRLRYDWLTRLAQERGLGLVLTAHTADDQAETVLMRLLRGTGLSGLRGIATERPLAPGVLLRRPLLTTTRAEIEAFLHSLGQPFRTDASNADTRLSRNRIRHELLPLLAREHNPAVARLLAQLAEQVGDVYAVLETAAAELLARAERPRAGAMIVLDAATMQTARPTVRVEALRQVWVREGWPLQGLGVEHWQRAQAVIAGTLLAADLLGPVRIRRNGTVVQVFPVL